MVQDVSVQAQVRHQSLQLRVLVPQLTELPQFAQSKTGILLLPQIERLLAMPCWRQTSTTLSPDSASRNTRRISSSLRPRFAISQFLLSFQRTTTGRHFSTSLWLSFWVLCQVIVPPQSVTDLPLLKNDPRSLLKIPFTQRVDHSKKRTLRLSFVVWASDLPPMSPGNRRLGPLLASRALRPQFRDTDQVEGRAAEHEQPIHLRQSA